MQLPQTAFSFPVLRVLCAQQEDDYDTELTPKQVVDRLDRYIVGQVCELLLLHFRSVVPRDLPPGPARPLS